MILIYIYIKCWTEHLSSLCLALSHILHQRQRDPVDTFLVSKSVMRATYFFSKQRIESHALETRTPGFPRAQHILKTKVSRLHPTFSCACLANPLVSSYCCCPPSSSFPLMDAGALQWVGQRAFHPVPAHPLHSCPSLLQTFSLLPNVNEAVQ